MPWYEVVNRFVPQWVLVVQAVAVLAIAVRAFRCREMYVISRWYLLGIGLAVVPAAVFYLDAALMNRPLVESIALSRISRVFLFGILGTILLLVSWNGCED